MNRVRRQVGASYAYEKGLTGAGIGVAVLDSGMDVTHPDLKNRVVYAYNYLNHTKDIFDDCGHGTHVCGIIGGTGVASGGRYQGLAPRCHFVSLKVLDEKGNGNSGSMIQALHWLMGHGKEYGVRIINISLGSTVQDTDGKSELVKAVEDACRMGFVVCAAAGNQGPKPSTITSPGTSEQVITVGASDDNQAVELMGTRKVNYSGRGPGQGNVIKPDIVAPGFSVVSCNAGWRGKDQKLYTAKSGTSMATPVVTGSLALLLSKEPRLSNQEIKVRLCDSCRNLGFPQNQQGCGMLDLTRLLK